MLLTAPALMLLAAAAGGDAFAWEGVELAQSSVTIRQSFIVRVPIPARRPGAVPSSGRWKLKKGPRCVAMTDVAGAQLTGPDSVDMIFRGGARIRAELEDACPALDYYNGFYLRPGSDGMVCADRDAIHARSGGECQIERFRKAVPAGR